MANKFHKDLTLDDVHPDIARIYADIAARDADTAFQVTANINKNVLITTPPSVFKLLSIGPPVWLEITGTGTDEFIELLDTPASYSGEAFKVVSVNAGETGLEFTVNAAGDVFGPASSVDNAVTRFNLATGKVIQDSKAILDDDGVLFLNTDQIEGLGLRVNASSGSGQIELDGPTGSSIIFQRVSTPEWDIRLLLNVPSTKVDFIIGDIPVGGGAAIIVRGGTRDTNIIKNLIVGSDDESPDSIVHILKETAGTVTAATNTLLTIENSTDAFLSFLTPNTDSKGIIFGDVADNDIGSIIYDNNDKLKFTTGAAERLRISGTLEASVASAQIIENGLGALQIAGAEISSFIEFHVGTGAGLFNIMTLDATAAVIGNAAAAASLSAVLELVSTDRGFLPPRMTTTQRNGIGSPSTGLQIDNSTTNELQRYNGTSWESVIGDVVGPASAVDNSVPSFDGVTGKLLQDPNALFITDTNRVGINTALPDSSLHVFDGSAGVFTPLAGTAALLENSGDIALTFAVPNANTAQILFGFPTSNVHAGIFYNKTSGFQFRNAGNVNRVCFDENGRVGIGETVPESILHVKAGAAGATAAPGGTTLTLESNTNNFITMFQPNADGGGILFGDPAVNVAGAFTYGSDDVFTWSTINNTIRMTLNSTGLRVGDTSAPTAGLDVVGSHANSRTAIADANHAVVAADYLLAITSITAARTITFSNAEIAKTGKEWPIKDESGLVSPTFTITLLTEGAQTIDGATSLVLNTSFFDLIIYTNGTNLFVRAA